MNDQGPRQGRDGDGLEQRASVGCAAVSMSVFERLATIAADRGPSASSQVDAILRLIADSLSLGLAFLARVDEEAGALHIVSAYDRMGMGLREGAVIPLCDTYCSSLLAARDGSLVVEDSAADPHFARLATTRDLGIGAYSGTLLHRADGAVYGTLCTLHPAVRTLRQGEIALLRLAGRLAVQAVESSELRHREARFRALTEHGSDLVSILAPDGTVLYDSPSHERILGAPLAEVQRRSGGATAAIHPDDWAQVQEAFAACIGGITPTATITCRHRHADGSWRTLECVVSNGLDHPAIGGLVLTSRDVTARKDAEEALRESEERLRALIRNAPLVLSEIDARGVFTFSAGRGLDAMGLPQHASVGRSAVEMYRDQPDIADGIRRVLSGEETSITVTLRGVPFEAHYTPLRDAAGRVTGAIAVAVDVSTTRAAEAALRESNRDLARSNAELEQFARIASHDLRSPLSSIGSFAQLLQMRYHGQLDAQADGYIDFIISGVARMQALIDALLAYARVDSQARPHAAVDCSSVARHALANLHAAVAEAGAAVDVGDLPTVSGDAAQLGQLLQNLISNALKFRRPDVAPAVRVWAERDARRDGRWTFAVRDNGIGIDPTRAPRIFAMFGRLHAQEEYEGMGIGLAVCQKIVERHGGRIWVESEPGAGATFRFTLPAA